MTPKYFEPYQQTIISCIISCTTPEQLACCKDMIERFKEVFKPLMTPITLHEKTGRLYEQYNKRQLQIGVL